MANEVKDIAYYETALIKKKRKVIVWRLAGISGWVIAAGLLGLIITPGALDRVDAMAQRATGPAETDALPAPKSTKTSMAATTTIKPKEAAPASPRTVGAWTLSTAGDGAWLLSQASDAGPILELKHNGTVWSVIVRPAAGGSAFAEKGTLRLDDGAPEPFSASDENGALVLGDAARVQSLLGKQKLELAVHAATDDTVVTATFAVAGLESVVSKE